MIEEPMKPKKKDQIRLDEEVTKRTKLVKGKEKRAGEELIQESTKKQKVEEDKEIAKIKRLMEIIPDKEEVAIDAIPLAVKSPRIVDWRIDKEGKRSYYQIPRWDYNPEKLRCCSGFIDKGKGIMIEEPVKPKKKDQIRLDEEVNKRLQAEFDKSERLAREKVQKEQE
nr:hypothetical protein [Tanacetum cinerariifolium]